jgi:hypothetical protein
LGAATPIRSQKMGKKSMPCITARFRHPSGRDDGHCCPPADGPGVPLFQAPVPHRTLIGCQLKPHKNLAKRRQKEQNSLMAWMFQERRIRVGIALAVIAAAIVAWNCRNCVWPRYQGHSASWWLDRVNPGSVESQYASSVEAFRAMGPPAVRYLGRTMASRYFLRQDPVE